MKRLLLGLMISWFGMASCGGDIRPQLRGAVFMVFAMNNMENPQPVKEKKQRYLRERQIPDNSNNHHFTQRRCNRQNARIHQPQSNNYATKNRR